MTDPGHRADRDAPQGAARPSVVLLGVRYGVPAAMIIGGIVLGLIGSGETAIEGLAMGVGGGLSVMLLNVLFRIGVEGEDERAQEDAARAYYSEHGRWPDSAQAESKPPEREGDSRG